MERVHGLGALRLAAILAALLVLVGGSVWVLADRGGSESADTELAGLSPETSPGTPPATDPNETDARADHEADRKRKQGRDREPRDRERATRRPRDDGTPKRSKPADPPGPEPEKQNVERVVEDLLGGGDPSRGSSQAALSDLPPEVRALIQPDDEQGSSNPPPGLDDLIEGGSGGD